LKRLVCWLLIILLLSSNVTVSAIQTSAKAAILINADTGEVIYENNADQKLPMASTTKIMTAVLLLENADLSTEITVTDQMLKVEGSSMGLLAGDKVTYNDLLYGLLLASGNDAANVIAITLGKTVNGFANMMNNKAKQLGLKNTNFVTPSGLDADGHYTTARDLAELTRYALKNDEFLKAVSSESKVLNFGNPPYKRTVTNHNKLLKGFDKAIGVKTGFTKKSGRCLVSAASEDQKTVIAVTLCDPDDWQDHKSLLSYGLKAVSVNEILPDVEDYKIPVIGADTDLEIKIEPYVVSYLKNSDFKAVVELPKFVYAPIKVGEKIGTVTYKKGDVIIDKLDIVAKTDINRKVYKKSFIREIKENFKYIISKIWEN